MTNDSPLKKTARQELFGRQQAYYDGNPVPQVKTRSSRVNDNLPLPMARIIVDKGASFLFGKDVQSQVGDAPSEGPQKWLDECWRRNKRGIFLLKLAINGGIFGHAFIRLIDSKPFPRIINLDPQTVEVETDPDDIDDVWSYTITPPLPPKDDNDPNPEPQIHKRTVITNQTAQEGYTEEEAESEWVIADQEYVGGQSGGWKVVRSEIWPYPFSPVIGCQNLPKPNDYWGESDIPQDIITLIDGINRTASHYNKLVRLFAHPKMWTRGMAAQKLDLSTDAIIHLPGETGELKVLETPADLPSIMGLLEKLLSLNAYAVRIPLIAMGQPDGAGALSGVSLQIRYQPLMEKTESKRLTYGDLLTEADHRLLEMGGFPALFTQAVWPELLPKDPMQEREAMILEDQLGITSKETFASQLGLDFAEEQKKRAAEAKTAADAMPMPLVPGQRVDDKTPVDHPVVAQAAQILPEQTRGVGQQKSEG